MNILYLLIEFVDELVFGVGETAWPFLRDDLQLTYTQIGLLLSLPGIIAAFIEPFIGILGDVWKRHLLIVTGGILFPFSLALTSLSTTFYLLLFSFILFFPSSGAFVSLSQANLMDSDRTRHEQNMARWTFAGSLGVLTGPLLLGSFVYFGLARDVCAACLALDPLPARGVKAAASRPGFRSVPPVPARGPRWLPRGIFCPQTR